MVFTYFEPLKLSGYKQLRFVLYQKILSFLCNLFYTLQVLLLIQVSSETHMGLLFPLGLLQCNFFKYPLANSVKPELLLFENHSKIDIYQDFCAMYIYFFFLMKMMLISFLGFFFNASSLDQNSLFSL